MSGRTTRRAFLAGTVGPAAAAAIPLAAAHPRSGEERALFARVVGEGPPVVFLHGLMGSSGYWSPAFDALASTRRLMFVDLAGFGRSVGVSGPYDVDGHARRVVSLLVDGPKPLLVGHSLGALVALRSAQLVDVEGVVAFNLPVYRSPDEARVLVGRAGLLERLVADRSPLAEAVCGLHDVARPLVRAVAPLLAPDLPADVARGGVDHTWSSFSRGFEAVVEARPRAWIDAARGPVHVVLGARDDVAPAIIAREVLAGAAARLSVLPRGHHLPLEATAACLDVVRAMSSSS